MPRSSLPVLVALVALTGCSAFGPSPSDVVFETAADEYTPGVEVTARLENVSDANVGYNLCYTTVERTGDSRHPLSQAPPVCLDVLRGLEPGGVAETTVSLPDDLPAGGYQLATTVELESGQRVEVTAPFEVR